MFLIRQRLTFNQCLLFIQATFSISVSVPQFLPSYTDELTLQVTSNRAQQGFRESTSTGTSKRGSAASTAKCRKACRWQLQQYEQCQSFDYKLLSNSATTLYTNMGRVCFFKLQFHAINSLTKALLLCVCIYLTGCRYCEKGSVGIGHTTEQRWLNWRCSKCTQHKTSNNTLIMVYPFCSCTQTNKISPHALNEIA